MNDIYGLRALLWSPLSDQVLPLLNLVYSLKLIPQLLPTSVLIPVKSGYDGGFEMKRKVHKCNVLLIDCKPRT